MTDNVRNEDERHEYDERERRNNDDRPECKCPRFVMDTGADTKFVALLDCFKEPSYPTRCSTNRPNNIRRTIYPIRHHTRLAGVMIESLIFVHSSVNSMVLWGCGESSVSRRCEMRCCLGCPVTVRVTTISGGAGAGAAVGRYYDQLVERQKDVARERVIDGPEAGVGDGVGAAVGGYYESASGSFWMGAGAERLGLSGTPGLWDIARLVDGVDADGQQLGRKFGETSARAFDVTFSVQKEVSILWAAGDSKVREVIEQTVVDAAMAVLEDQVGARAATRMRTGPDGEFLAADHKPVMVDAEGPAVAVIPEFTSRKGDPQLHVHALISSKVWEPTTERWLALEARELKHDQRAMSGLFHASLETGLSKHLGVTWGAREYTYARTIDGIDQTLVDVFSQRRADVDARLETKLARFEEQLGHAPTPQQRWRLEREAAVDSRPGKSPEVLDFAGWQATITEHTGMTPAELVASVTGNTDVSHTMTQAALDQMITATLGELSDSKSSWTRGDFKAEFTRVLPPGLAATPTELVAFVNTQTDAALADLLQVTPVTVDRPNRRWTTPEVLGQEAKILDHIDRATRIEIAPSPSVAAYAPEWMDQLQLAAAARVASRSDFEVVIGLAGAGKTSMLATAVEALHVEGRDVFGLAPSAAAAQVLGEQVDMGTENVSKFLWEHTQRNGGPNPEFELSTGSTLIVDEAGMVSTPQWDSLTQLAQTNGWRIVAVGDGYQFAAVGRGGIFDHLANTLPEHRISRLEQVHRFDNDWEADASAALRQGDTTVLDVYEANDRIVATGGQDLAETVTALYLERRAAGVEVGVFAATNVQVAELNRSIQEALADLGQLGPPITGTGLFVGDQIETRNNNRHLVTDQNQFVKNRDRWTITDTNRDGGLVVTGAAGTVTLPSEYVGEHVNLAYAQTAHASQGRTIAGTSIYAYNPEQAPADRAGIYVPMTRGKHDNIAVVQANSIDIAKTHLEDAISRRWIDQPAISHLHEQPTPTKPPIPLTKQTDTARQVLQKFEQQTLFDTAPTPKTPHPAAPVIEPKRTGAKRRGEAKPRQHRPPPEPSIETPTPPLTSPPELRPEEVAVVSAGEVAAMSLPVHVRELFEARDTAQSQIVMSEYGIEETPRRLADLDDRYEKLSIERNTLADQFNDLSADSHKLLGRKPREQEMSRLEERISDIDAQRAELKTEHGVVTNNLPIHQQNLTTATDNLTAIDTQIDLERITLGQTRMSDPKVLDRLGDPGPTPTTGWLRAAGAITQHDAIRSHSFDTVDDLDLSLLTRTIGQQAQALTKDINPQINAPSIEGPGLSL